MGTVNLAILASTIPGVADDIHTQLSRSHPDKLQKRGLFSAIHKAVDKAGDAIKNAAGHVKDGVVNAVHDVKVGVENAVHDANDGVENTVDDAEAGMEDGVECACGSRSPWRYLLTEELGLEDHTRYNVDLSTNKTLFNFDKSGTVFKQAITCNPFTFGIDIEMDLQASANAGFSVAISGTIVPPTFSQFKIIPCMWVPVDGWIVRHLTILIRQRFPPMWSG